MVIHLLDGLQGRAEVADILDPRLMSKRLGRPRLHLLYFWRLERPENAEITIPDAVVNVAVSTIAQHIVDIVRRYQYLAGPKSSALDVLCNDPDFYGGEQIAEI